MQLIDNSSTQLICIGGFTEVHMWRKYCPLIGRNSYTLLTNFTKLQLDCKEHSWNNYWRLRAAVVCSRCRQNRKWGNREFKKRQRNTTNQWFDWLNEGTNRAARASHFWCNFFDIISQSETTTWNFHISGSDDNARPQQYMPHSLPSRENHSCQASESTVCLLCTTWPKWNNRNTLKPR